MPCVRLRERLGNQQLENLSSLEHFDLWHQIWPDLVRVQLPVWQLVESMQPNLCCSNIVKIPPAVYPQVCADCQPQVPLSVAMPVLQNEPGNGAPFPYPSACADSLKMSVRCPYRIYLSNIICHNPVRQSRIAATHFPRGQFEANALHVLLQGP